MRLTSKDVYLYSISDKIENSYYVNTGFQDKADDFSINIMNNIPGIHIEDTGASVFDCNDDGIDELFFYG